MKSARHILGLAIAVLAMAGALAADAGIRQPQRNARRIPVAAFSVGATLDYLVAGGGSGGGGIGNDTGGGGDVQYAANQSAPAVGSYPVVVGTGAPPAGQATSSSFNSVTANGNQGANSSPGANAGNYSISGASLDYGTANTAANASRGRGAANPGDGSSVTGENGTVIIRYLTGSQTWTGCTQTIDGAYTVRTCTVSTTLNRTS